MDIWQAINASPTIKVENFDELKNDARVWIGRLECGIISVGGILDTHGMGVLSMYLENASSEWSVLTFKLFLII